MPDGETDAPSTTMASDGTSRGWTAVHWFKRCASGLNEKEDDSGETDQAANAVASTASGAHVP